MASGFIPRSVQATPSAISAKIAGVYMSSGDCTIARRIENPKVWIQYTEHVEFFDNKRRKVPALIVYAYNAEAGQRLAELSIVEGRTDSSRVGLSEEWSLESSKTHLLHTAVQKNGDNQQTKTHRFQFTDEALTQLQLEVTTAIPGGSEARRRCSLERIDAESKTTLAPVFKNRSSIRSLSRIQSLLGDYKPVDQELLTDRVLVVRPGTLTRAQIRELYGVYALQVEQGFGESITIQKHKSPMSAGQALALAQRTQKTLIGVNSDSDQKEWVQKFVNELSEWILTNIDAFTIYEIHFSSGDASAEALMIHDEATGEVTFLGSEYFS
jgi:hypothetical protein